LERSTLPLMSMSPWVGPKGGAGAAGSDPPCCSPSGACERAEQAVRSESV
jgi:hypothetical protein